MYTRLPIAVQRVLFRALRSNLRNKLRAHASPGYMSLEQAVGTRTILVHVPKAAGLSVAAALYGNYGIGHIPLRRVAILLTDHEWRTTYRFAFARNPFSRLESAYRFLVQGGMSPNDRSFYWSVLHGKIRSFEEFVEWLDRDRMPLTPHLSPQVDFLRIRQGRRDLHFLGHVERLDSDYSCLRSELGFGGALDHKNRSMGPRATAWGSRMVDKILDLYESDFEALGYHRDPMIREPIKAAQSVAQYSGAR